MEIFYKILASFGGSTIVLGGLFYWLGKRYLDKNLEAERRKTQEFLKKLESDLSKEIESYKTHLKYDEIFFKALYNSSQDLYKIRTSVSKDINPLPDWDWEDVCSHISTKFKETGIMLTKFLENYYTALPPDIFEELEKAKYICEDGEAEITRDPYNHSAGYKQADELWSILNTMSVQLKSTIDDKRIIEFRPIYIKKHNLANSADAKMPRG